MKGISCGILRHEPVSDIGFNDFGHGRCHL
jgi:hypothetical protein